MNSGSVDLVATDPPFNKGKDFHATPDSLAAGAKFQDRWSWADDVEGDWVDQLKDDWPDVWQVIGAARCSWGDDLGAFLCFMAVRLVEMRRILKKTGSIYLHCDPTASHYLKQLMDAIFGRKQFRNEIVWFYPDSPGRPRRDFARKHDIILRYVKSSDWVFNADDVRVPILAASKERYKKPRVIGGRSYTGGKAADIGKIPETVWQMPVVKQNSKQAYGYPTQKPLPLYERIIAASSDPGDIVLDPFCGCATTAVAAERLGRQWVGIDIWEKAHQAVLDRMQHEGMAVPDAEAANSRLFTFGDVTYSAAPPSRTDDGDTAAPYLQVTERVKEPAGPKWTREEMYEHLLAQHGSRCMGCDRAFDDPRYLELDHNTPRSDGGINHVSNRVLLCGPCNRLKSNTFTLSGLRRENKKHGYMTT